MEGRGGREGRGLTGHAPAKLPPPRPGFRSLRIKAWTATWAAAPSRWASTGKGCVAGSLAPSRRICGRGPPVPLFPRPTSRMPRGALPSPSGALSLSQDLLGAEAGAGGPRSAWEGPWLRRGHLWGRKLKSRVRGPALLAVGGPTQQGPQQLCAGGRQTTHRARGRDRGYFEAGVRASAQASPRAAWPRLWV